MYDDDNTQNQNSLQHKVKREAVQFVHGEVKSFLIWKFLAGISLLVGSYTAIPAVSKTIAAQRPAGYGMFECHNRKGKLIATPNLSECKSKREAEFKPF